MNGPNRMIHKTESDLDAVIERYKARDPEALSEAEAEGFALAMEASLRLKDLKNIYLSKMGVDKLTIAGLCGKLSSDDHELVELLCFDMKTAAKKIHGMIKSIWERQAPGIPELKKLLWNLEQIDQFELSIAVPGYSWREINEMLHRDREGFIALLRNLAEQYDNPYISTFLIVRREQDGWIVSDDNSQLPERLRLQDVRLDSDSKLKKFLLGNFAEIGFNFIWLFWQNNVRLPQDLVGDLNYERPE